MMLMGMFSKEIYELFDLQENRVIESGNPF